VASGFTGEEKVKQALSSRANDNSKLFYPIYISTWSSLKMPPHVTIEAKTNASQGRKHECICISVKSRKTARKRNVYGKLL
jgi:hypothetical protein